MSRADLCGKGPKGGPKATVVQGMTTNTPPLIEAADTPPFFHNNSAATLEDAVAFYTSDTFHNSIAGARQRCVRAQRGGDQPDRSVSARAQRPGEHPQQQGYDQAQRLDPAELALRTSC